MEIVTHGHDNENAVRQIMQLFFSLNDHIKVESRLEECIAEATITLDGKVYTGSAGAESNERLYVTNAVKKSVFYAAKKISKMPTPWGISTGIRPAKTARKMLDDSCKEEDILSHLKSEYLMEDKKAELALSVAKKERAILKSMPSNSVSIYVGIPFCPTRCSYCSFISQATAHNNKFTEPYTDAVLKEIEHTGEIIRDLGMRVDTVYFGGGTPTAIKPCLLEKIITKLQSAVDFSAVREFTVEAGRPDTFTKEMMDMLKRTGVDRVSVNPQTMHQKTLDKVGRRHSTEDVYKAFDMAKAAGIKSINADLIAGLPGENEDMISESVDKILLSEPQSITVHTLYMKRAAGMIDEFEKLRFTENVSAMVDRAFSMLTKEEIYPYYMYKQRNTLGNLENVGFAKNGHESLYNVYIMEEVQPILAIGAGGSTKMVDGDCIERVYNPKDAADYIKRIDEVLKRKDVFFNFYDKRRK